MLTEDLIFGQKHSDFVSLKTVQRRGAQHGAMGGLPSASRVLDYRNNNCMASPTKLSWLNILIELMRLMLPVMTTWKMTDTTLMKPDCSIECHPLLGLPSRKLIPVKEITPDLLMASVSMQVVPTSENHSLLALPAAYAALESGPLAIGFIISVIIIKRLG